MLTMIAAAVMFSTTPSTEMPMMSATMKVAACERFTSVETNGTPDLLTLANWAPKDRELASYAIEQGRKIAPSMTRSHCAYIISKTAVEITALAQGL